jgi:alcohol dehydrogenase (cytochrome c)
VYVGNAGGDQAGVTGHVYALDANDGHVVWKFDVVPETGPARATWTNPKLPISGGAFWTSFTLDEADGVLYVPAGNPAPGFDAELRTGDNLYTDSVIAIDAATGRMLGYNQVVKRDSHDWDVDTAPTLATTRSGKRIVASANKDGLLSILDRSRVTRGATPAELTAVLPLLSQTPTTTRENVDVPLSRDHAVRFCPGIQGGVEWNGAVFSPQSNSLFVAAVDWCANVQLKREIEVPSAGGVAGSVHIGGIVRRTAHPNGKKYARGPQMVEISRDGKRVYWTNSLYSTWITNSIPTECRAPRLWPMRTRAAALRWQRITG